MNRFPIYLILAAASLASCTKMPEEDSAGDSICFRTDLVSVSESPLSKAEIVSAAGKTIYVTETIGGTFSNDDYDLPSGTGVLKTEKEWWNGQEYNFFAYMCDGGGVRGILDNGRRFTISQPDTPSYDGTNSNFSDYLLSYTYYVEDGAAKPLVTFEMVHATAAVELHLVKPAGAAETKVLSATMSGVSTTAEYSVNEHTGSNISWTVERKATDTADYTRMADDSDFSVPEADAGYYPDGSLYFYFLACQQPVDPVTIEVSFSVAGDRAYTVSFPLAQVEGVPYWMPGTKTRYAVVLDSEARIYGSIENWKDGGEMEGSLVP